MKYIVTDPCYIIDNDSWVSLCVNYPEDLEKSLEKLLTSITKKKSFVSDTKCGDWVNFLVGQGVIQNSFTADSGMVCVCAYTDTLKKNLSEKLMSDCCALFETKDLIDVMFDKSGNATKVVIITAEGDISSTYNGN